MTSPAPRDPTFRRDIVSAYVAAASRIGSWVVVSAMVYRAFGAPAFAMLALVRGTIGLLNYITLGLAPALIHWSASAGRRPDNEPPKSGSTTDISLPALHSTALGIVYAAGAVGLVLICIYAASFEHLYNVFESFHGEMAPLVLWIGIGTLLRLMGDAPGAVLQVQSGIAYDNHLIALAELVWAVSGVVVVVVTSPPGGLILVGACYACSGLVSFAARSAAAGRRTGIGGPRFALMNSACARALLSYGSMVVLAQLADYLYAPTDYMLIDRLMHPIALSAYAPAVQIDAGLLLLVSGLSAVLLPKTAVAHAAGSSDTVRRYYVRGTLASLAMLAAASAIIWLISPWILRLWLGDPMPATQAILPLVLLNTVLGGSSAVGRSILLAVGRVRPFTVAALTSGAANVACSYVFVRYLGLGLKGIVLGTVVAVVGRCVIWMPWYVLRTIRSAAPVEPLMPVPVAPQA